MTPQSESPSSPSPVLLARYLSGEADQDERAGVERWMAASPEHRAQVDAMRAAWDRPPVPVFDPDGRIWERLKAEIAGSTPVQSQGAARPRAARLGRRRRRSWLAVAAAAVLVVGTGLTMWPFPARLVEWVSSTQREIATQRGERLALRLADGTRVVLAPESRLRLTDGVSAHGRGPREVYLDGEALFEVVHDSVRPFLVHTATATAEDLGTEFVVTSYPETGGTRVVVASGIVELQEPGRPLPGDRHVSTVTLAHGDLGFISAAHSIHREQGIDIGPYVSWAEGVLAFDGTPLREVVPALRRWYDIDLRVGDPELAEMKLTAAFRDESIEQVLALIAMSLDLAIERHGTSVTLQ